ncbi:MAG: PHP domain-containing protein, partial [Cetobacterium sp.]
KMAGGIAILAHPKLISTNENFIEKLIIDLKNKGLDGIEAEYGSFTKKDMIKYSKLAKELNLLITGGSDFHGLNREGVDLGDGGINTENYLKLKNKKI